MLQDAAGRELLEQPLDGRRRRLQRLLVSAPPQLALCPQTSDELTARTWFTEWAVSGIEGVLVKPHYSRYRPGEAGWVKVKNEMNCIGRNISRTARLSFVLVN